MSKPIKWVILIALVAFIGIVGLFIFYFSPPKACTLEAKICPDGSSVSRTLPNCEFAACPEPNLQEITIYCVNNNCQPEQLAAGAGTLVQGCYRSLDECTTASSTCSISGGCTASSSLETRIDKDQNIEYQYLKKLPTTYIRGQSWPPTVNVVAGDLLCQGSSASTSSPAVTATERTIGGQAFCVKLAVEGAAGSVYTEYTYSMLKEGKLVTVRFTLQAPQCANYNQTEQVACEAERQAFNPDSLVTPIIDSLKIKQASAEAINIENIQSNQLIASPLVIDGQALGKWYFEAVFPIVLQDGTGKEIARTQARATSDWMASGFVPFEATLTFSVPTTATGTLVFQNDNPSGLPANRETFALPIRFVQ